MYNNYGSLSYRTADELNSAMGRVYGHMGLAVVTSMLVSYFVGSDPELVKFFFTGIMKWIVIFAPLVAVFGVSFLLNSDISKGAAQACLHGFAALMGLSFAAIFAVFKLGSIISAFMGAGVLFGVLSFWGYFTKQDLDSLGKWLFAGLIAILIASIINVFVGSSLAQMVISSLAIVIFLGLTAYDTQKIREELAGNTDSVAEVRGALHLYLDFINLFIHLLQIIGVKKD